MLPGGLSVAIAIALVALLNLACVMLRSKRVGRRGLQIRSGSMLYELEVVERVGVWCRCRPLSIDGVVCRRRFQRVMRIWVSEDSVYWIDECVSCADASVKAKAQESAKGLAPKIAKDLGVDLQ